MAYSRDIRWLVVYKSVVLRLTVPDICDELSCGATFVKGIILMFNATGDILGKLHQPRAQRPQRKRKVMTPATCERLLRLVVEDPAATVSEPRMSLLASTGDISETRAAHLRS